MRSAQPMETFQGYLDVQEKYAMQKNQNKGGAKKTEEIDIDTNILNKEETY